MIFARFILDHAWGCIGVALAFFIVCAGVKLLFVRL